MSLLNMDSANGYLEAVGGDGEAVSLQRVQATGANISETTLETINTNLVPLMTSNTAPSGIVTESSVQFAGYEGFKAFDREISTAWGAGDWTNWLAYEFPTNQEVSGFTLECAGDTSPNEFTFEGWNGTSYDILYTHPASANPFGAGQTIVDFNLGTTYTQYKKFRLNITSNYTGGANGNMYIYGFEIYSSAYVNQDVLTTSTVIADGDALVIEKNDGSFHPIIAAGVTGTGPYTMDTSSITAGEVPSKVYLASGFEADLADARNISMDVEFANISESSQAAIQKAIPDMTSNTSPSGVASSNYEHSQGGGVYLSAWKAFNRSTTAVSTGDYWLGLAVGHYLQYQSSTPMTIDGYEIWSRTDHPAAPAAGWDIHVSDDGINWTLVDSQSSQSFTQGQVKTYNLSQSVTATYIKFTVVTLNPTWNQCNIAEFAPFSSSVNYNTLKTSTTLANGDKLAIVLQDNSIHEVIASGVTGTGPYTMDTTSITAGEIPTQVYRLNAADAGVSFNNVPALNPIDTLTFGTTLQSTRTFDDVELAGRTLETKVNLTQGNKMIRLSADIYKDA